MTLWEQRSMWFLTVAGDQLIQEFRYENVVVVLLAVPLPNE